MKSILPIIILSIIVAGCKEEAQYCWKCNYTFSGTQPDKTGDTILCNFTKTDIELRQDKAFGTHVTGYDRWMMTNCKQQ